MQISKNHVKINAEVKPSPQFDDLLPKPQRSFEERIQDKSKKKRRRKSPSIIDLLIPAPMFDPNDVEQTKNLKVKVKVDEKGKFVAPSADQLQHAFIRKEQKNLRQKIRDGH